MASLHHIFTPQPLLTVHPYSSFVSSQTLDMVLVADSKQPRQNEIGVKKASSVSGSYRPSSTAFDPRALLDPKRFSQRPASEDRTLQSDQPGARTLLSSQMGVRTLPWTAQPTSRAEATQPDDVNLSGMGSLIERIHGVSHREGPPLKRQKLVMDEQENSDHEGTDSNFSGGGKGGVIGDYIRQKRAEGKQEAALMSTVVDLTGGEIHDRVVSATFG